MASGPKALYRYNRAMLMPAIRPVKVAIVAYDGIRPFHLSVPCLVFGTENRGPGALAFDIAVCALEERQVRTTSGFAIVASHGLEGMEDADIVVVPSWHDDCRIAPDALLDSLRRAHARGAQLVGLCFGTFPLAQAGLLDGKAAATHWEAAAMLAERYPRVKVDQDVLYVDEGTILTSAGVAAGLDCCLHLLRRMCGAEVANKVAKRLLVAPHRDGGQAQFIERPMPGTGSEGRFTQVLDWVGQHLEEEHTIDALAARAAMSRRNFTRHFRLAMGTSFKQWLLNQRLIHAQRLLEGSEASVEAIAHAAGFGNALSLRQHFRTVLRTSPSAYRKQFRLRAAQSQA
jgi:transcriptional regulator GlxA family with amidase domain